MKWRKLIGIGLESASANRQNSSGSLGVRKKLLNDRCEGAKQSSCGPSQRAPDSAQEERKSISALRTTAAIEASLAPAESRHNSTQRDPAVNTQRRQAGVDT